jgi:O-antigen/teichoic acid export membrane protein
MTTVSGKAAPLGAVSGLRRRAAAVLPPGATAVGLGLCVSGAGAYAFLALASHELSAQQYAPLATFWSLTFLLGPGSFGILERETGRRVAVGLVRPPSERRPLTDIYVFGAIEVAVVALALAIGHTTISSRLFDGQSWMVLAAVVAVPSIGVEFLTFGILAGNRTFRSYGLVTGMEGTGRLAGGAILLLVGIRDATDFGFIVALAPTLAALCGIRALRSSERQGAPVDTTHGLGTMLWLLGSSLIQAFLINAGPLLVKLLSSRSEAAQTGRFLSGLVLVRVPLFLYSAAAATLLPALAGAATREDWRGFRNQLDRLGLCILGLAMTSVTLAATIGPALLRVIFGATYSLDRPTLCAMATATSLLLVAATFGIALTSTGAVRFLFVCSLIGLGATFLPILFLHGLFVRVEFGLIAGSAGAALSMAAGLYLPRVPLHARTREPGIDADTVAAEAGRT